MLQIVIDILNSIEQILGFSPVLMLPVFVFVSIISRVFDVRNRLSSWSDLILGILCLLVSGGVIYTTDYETFKEFLRNTLILGSVSALTYQIFKGLLIGVKDWIEELFENRTGIDIDIKRG